MKQGYRIISIEAADIYRHEQENGVSVGYKMPENKSDAYFRLFKIYLDNSLDLIELEKSKTFIKNEKFPRGQLCRNGPEDTNPAFRQDSGCVFGTFIVR